MNVNFFFVSFYFILVFYFYLFFVVREFEGLDMRAGLAWLKKKKSNYM